MTSLRQSILVSALTAGVAIAVIAAIVPDLPPLAVLGGDAPNYARIAEHPFQAVSGAPEAERLLTPLVVAALPFSTSTGFLVVSVVSIVLGSLCVSLICRRFELSLGSQAAAAALTAGSYIGVHGVFNQYYVDPEALLVTALALLLVFERRQRLFALAMAFGVPVKEIAITLAALPYLVWRRQGVLWDRRLLVRTIVLALPTVAATILVNRFAPVVDLGGHDPRRMFFTAFDPVAGLRRGFLTAVANPIFALFGAAWVLWPLGVARCPRDLRRAHLWIVIAFVPLALGSWERTMGVFVPLAIPAALWLLRSAPPAVLGTFTAGSFWVSGIVGAITIGENGTTAAFKAALIAPGLAVAWGALVWELRRRRRQGEQILRRPSVRAGRA